MAIGAEQAAIRAACWSDFRVGGVAPAGRPTFVLGMLGIEPDRPPTKKTFAGLPMPDKVWDDERITV